MYSFDNRNVLEEISLLFEDLLLMIDCGILSTVQVIVAVSFSLTTLSLEILEIVG
jgi:hypothetical protein